MKKKHIILIIILSIILIFSVFLSLPAIIKPIGCSTGFYPVEGNCIPNYDVFSILHGMLQERLDYVAFDDSDSCPLFCPKDDFENDEAEKCKSDLSPNDEFYYYDDELCELIPKDIDLD